MRVGVDTGGTFTDVVAANGEIRKLLSTPADPAAAVAAGIAGLDVDSLAHGTTVATNALLERRGATVALVTSAGFGDVIEIGRQDRPSLYDPFIDRPPPLVDREHRYEVGGRLGADGAELEPLDVSSLPEIAEEVDEVAVCLLHSDLDPRHEQALTDALVATGRRVSCSSAVSPEFREYECTVTTVVNAYLRPACEDYLGRIAELAAEALVMTSAGGLVPVSLAADRPAALLLSGPAGGVLAGAAAAAAAGFPDAVTFDMGGTSTDVCLVLDGAPAPAAQRTVGGFPVRLPSLDIHTIGAGGGSIARIDTGGALVVGPESAGASPGPACYGLGGKEPTVTDADLVVGHLPFDAVLPGLGPVDIDAALAALDGAGVDAEGVVAVVDAAMVQAVRAVTVARGVDPRGLALIAFGGAGPMHACAVADALGMAAVVVPARAGVLSAVGILTARRQADLVRSWPAPLDHDGLAQARYDLARAAARAVLDLPDEVHARVLIEAGTNLASVAVQDGPRVVVELSVDCRYRGQSHELTVATPADFAEEHQRRNGFSRADAPVEVVALRASARLPAPLALEGLPTAAGPPRRPAVGPTLLAEADCTVWVAEGWRAEVGGGGAWVLRREGSAS
jgi:N-methylhydantoinase A/oxoprolinase/acetone carboxylase beta subunit